MVGRGCKRVLLGGLKPYDAQLMAVAVDEYNARKQAFALA